MTDAYAKWVGKTTQAIDNISPFPSQAMAATLDGVQRMVCVEGSLPLLWHWLHFLDQPQRTNLAHDGHEKRGGFLPPVELPRRMWAAGHIQFFGPLRLNSEAKRESRIESIKQKQGKSGELVFVDVRHEIYAGPELAISELQTIVYREAATGTAATQGKPIEELPDYETQVAPDVALLFRYSALTFNAHRIHYDREYACETEGYPGLVVHGPLLATLLIGAAQEAHPDKQIEEFQFRAVKPVFDLAPFRVCGQQADEEGRVRLWIADEQNELCMQATAKLAS